MQSKLSNWLETILKVVGVVGVVSTIGAFIKQWYQGIDRTELILILIALFCILSAVVILFFRWREQRKYENIPYLIERRDNFTMENIDRFEINLDGETWIALIKELAELINWKIDNVLKAFPTKDEKLILKEFENAMKSYNNKLIPQKKTDETLILLLEMGSILNNYHAGLQNITNKPECVKLYITS